VCAKWPLEKIRKEVMEEHEVKWINLGASARPIPILCQSVNGPCPLLAMCK
jgi:hypothetical protein